MSKSLTESPALLTVHDGTPGQFIVRVRDVRLRSLVIGVTKLLSTEAAAQSFVLITPTDTKVFMAQDTRAEEAPGNVVIEFPDTIADEGAPPQVDAETQAAIDAEMGTRPSATEESAPAKPRTRPARPKQPPKAGHAEACGRCRGAGRIQVLGDGGVPTEAPCGVCQGSGTIQRYGARR